MKYTYILIFLVLLTASCSQKHHQVIQIGDQEYEVSRPPNMVRVDDNLYADQTEIRNIDWLEYSYWLKQKYGEDSNEYENSLPDTTVWSGEISYGEPILTSYFRHPAYASYPVVGVDYKQVKDYCFWRTDRVAEAILYQKGILDYDDEYQYLRNDELYQMVEREKIYFPIFRLPTEQEWEQIASGGLALNDHPNGFDFGKTNSKKTVVAFNVKFPEKVQDLKFAYATTTSPVISYKPNKYKIYNAVGNVAEMVDEKGISKGGSFEHYMDECHIEEQIVYAKPEKWLGFRCVAYYDPAQFKEG